MTVAMNARIIFPVREGRQQIEIRKTNSVQVESSWMLLTDRAEIVLPRNIKFFDRNNIREVFRRGDPVEIQLGYDGELHTEFTGYITEVSADIPIRLKCEDEMWKIKQLQVNYSAKNVTLKTLLEAIVPGYEITAVDASLGTVRFSKVTAGQVLEKLQQDWKLYTYIQPGTKQVVSGEIYADNTDHETVRFNLERNAESSDLQYLRAEDMRVFIKGFAIDKGRRIEYEFGDKDAQVTIDWQFSVQALKELKEAVQRFYQANKKDGFDGSFTAFGKPRVEHGWKVHLTSLLYPDRDGTYYVESVTKEFGRNGYRQQIKLGNRATE
ncbi:hypothetical protein LS482_16210 [Sinomicrobium kalidii]|uniref:hypothetical protein n=1 Tax=Sinomicrobium kalidii TaxID=2900738 RepID=UPI001E5A8C7D|nr:hypothetical protein [Sinomicrobium kalidii]UGU15217.1 hypothetical protein LS482_16210 [Sinomicrobium kalidii]